MYYWWNIRRLAEELVEKRVTNTLQWGYLFVWIMVICPVFLFTGPRNGPLLPSLASMFIIGVGITVCVRLNERGDAQDFIVRFICLGTTLGLRLFLLLFIPAEIIRRIVENHYGYSLPSQIIQVVYFWRLHHWVGVVSRRKLNGDVLSDPNLSDVS